MIRVIAAAWLLLGTAVAGEPAKKQVDHAAAAQSALNNYKTAKKLWFVTRLNGGSADDVMNIVVKEQQKFLRHCKATGRDELTCNERIEKADAEVDNYVRRL
jgi:hypothetical protein